MVATDQPVMVVFMRGAACRLLIAGAIPLLIAAPIAASQPEWPDYLRPAATTFVLLQTGTTTTTTTTTTTRTSTTTTTTTTTTTATTTISSTTTTASSTTSTTRTTTSSSTTTTTNLFGQLEFEIAIAEESAETSSAQRFEPGAELTLLVDVVNHASQAVVVDPYLVMLRPDGQFFSYVFPDSFVLGDPNNFPASLRPVVPGIAIPAGLELRNAPLFSLPIGTVIPAQQQGSHQFLAAFAIHGGPLELITPIDSASFEVTPVP